MTQAKNAAARRRLAGGGDVVLDTAKAIGAPTVAPNGLVVDSLDDITIDEVVFAERSDLCLLGVRTLEGFGVMVDNVGHRLVAVTTVAASSAAP